MNPASIPDEEAIAAMSASERDGSFHHAALWKRALIVFAGPLTNVIVALGIFTAFNLAYGKPVPPDPAHANIVGALIPGSAAEKAGIAPDDKVVAIGSTPVRDVMEVAQQVMLYPGRSSSVTVLREGRELTMPVTFGSAVERDQFGNTSTVGRIGVRWKYVERPRFEAVGPGEAVAMSFRQSAAVVDMMVTGIAQIVSGQRSVKELGGPLKIAKFSGEQLSLGAQSFIWFAALISLNLAFINLLPIPALDGGHLAFYAAEAVRRKPIGARGQEMAFRAGVAMILALMLFVTVNDLLSLPLFGR
jgi:regulator of sigma E protease